MEPFQAEIDSKRESTRVLSLLLLFVLRSGLEQKYVSFPPYNILWQAVKNNAFMDALSDTGKFSRGFARFPCAKQKEIVKETPRTVLVCRWVSNGGIRDNSEMV